MSPLILAEPAPGWARRQGRRWGTGLVVVGLHLALLLAWRLALRPQVEVQVALTPPPGGLLWLRAEQPQVATPSEAPGRPARAPARPASPAARPAPQAPAPGALPLATRPRPPAPAEGTWVAPAAPGVATPPPADVAAAAAPAAPPASAPLPPAGSLMDSEATRQAIRQAARQPLLSERAATATGEPFRTADSRLAEAAAQAGKGDCMKGEYPGGGAGLLSLPFLAAAVARGQCAK